MRELTREEIKKRGCEYCTDARKKTIKGEFVPYEGDAQGNKKFLWCSNDKCPYKSDTEPTSFGLFDRVGGYYG